MNLSSLKHRVRLVAQQSMIKSILWLGPRGLVPARLVAGKRDAGSIPVVMCLWNRPDRLPKILEMLSAQDIDRPVRLILWNNQRRNGRRYRGVIDDYTVHGSLASVEVVESPANIGGIGRFFAIARLRRAKLSGPVVLLDDDQDVTATFVQDLLGRYTPDSVHGVWAYRQRTSYWDRDEVFDGEDATYVGTGGCIVNSAIVDDSRFFTAFPRRFMFLEDIWMNFVAVQHGWRLARIETPYEFVQEETGQHFVLRAMKDEFFAYLHSDESREMWKSAAR